MKSLWSDTTIEEIAGSPLQLRVYSSRLLGQDPDLGDIETEGFAPVRSDVLQHMMAFSGLTTGIPG